MIPAVLFYPENIYSGWLKKKSKNESIKGHVFKDSGPEKLWKWSKKAYFYREMTNDLVRCTLCPNRCILSPNDRSVCRSRVNYRGTLYSLAYGNPCAVNVDPIEKKPLFHYRPGTKSFSIAAAGCNFRCLNCQNWQISQSRPEDLKNYDLFPDKVVSHAAEAGAVSIAYTYSEAITFYEYMTDCAKLAKKNNIGSLWISNGYINKKPLAQLCSLLDAANINLKAYSDEIYQKLNGGRLAPVLNTFETLARKNIHFEITNLVIPGYTDDEAMMKKMCSWILETLGPSYPLHFLRFFPQYKLDRLGPTPVKTLTRFRKIAMDLGIQYVYVGNVPRHEGNHTFCHSCGKMIIKRAGYFIPEINIRDSRCIYCNTRIPGVL